MAKKSDQQIISEAINSYVASAPLLESGDRVKTPVMFRRYRDRHKEVFAVFPHHADPRGNLVSYDHVGQHGAAHPEFVTKETDPVEHDHPDAQALGKELTSRGYDLEPVAGAMHTKTIRRLRAHR